MKRSIAKIFKLNEPLGRKLFGLIVLNIYILNVLMNIFQRMYFNKSTLWYTYIAVAIITPFAVRRLKDIDANEFLSGLFMLPMLHALYFYSTIMIPFMKTDVFDPYAGFTVMFMIFFPLIIVILFLCLLLIKGSKDNVRKFRFIRKNTLIINAIILSYILICFSYYQYEVYRAEKTAMTIINALDKFKDEKGYYPKKIKKIVPEFLSEMPEEKGFLAMTRYDYWGSGKNCKEQKFCINFMTLAGAFPKYCSNKREWIDLD